MTAQQNKPIKAAVKNSFRMQRLHNRRPECLADDINTSKPPPPIVEVNNKTLKVALNSAVIRNFGLIPGLLTLLFLLGDYLLDIQRNWKSYERRTLEYIEIKKKKYGDDYFEATQDEVDIDWYNDLGGDLELTLTEYFSNVRYEAYTHSEERFRMDIFACFFFGIGIPLMLFFIIRFKRRAPLIFDRERQIFYTWHKGRVWVQHFKDMEFQEHVQGLMIPVPAKPPAKSKGPLLWPIFRVIPKGNLYFNHPKDFKNLLSYVTQYMEYGREHVMPNQTQWTKKIRDGLFYKDPKPNDLEDQIREVLTLIEKNHPLWEADIKAREEKEAQQT